MKRRLISVLICASMMMVVVLTRHGIVAAELDSSWQPNGVDELTRDEWPVDEETMDEDEHIYEMEAIEAERQEQQMFTNNNNQAELAEEEDDVDQDDIEEDDDDDEEEEEEGQESVYFKDSDVKQEQLPLDESGTDQFDDLVFPLPEDHNNQPKATTKLQQQEEQDLEVLDQSIIDTLQSALDAMKQDRPIRFTPANTTTITTNMTTSDTVSPSPSPSSSSSSSSSNLFVALIHYLISWTSYGSLCILLILAILLISKKYKQRSIRDHHHLPSYSVYKQKSSVD